MRFIPTLPPTLAGWISVRGARYEPHPLLLLGLACWWTARHSGTHPPVQAASRPPDALQQSALASPVAAETISPHPVASSVVVSAPGSVDHPPGLRALPAIADRG